MASDEKFLDEGIEDSNGNSAGVVIHPISCNFLPSHFIFTITNDQYDSVTVALKALNFEGLLHHSGAGQIEVGCVKACRPRSLKCSV